MSVIFASTATRARHIETQAQPWTMTWMKYKNTHHRHYSNNALSLVKRRLLPQATHGQPIMCK